MCHWEYLVSPLKILSNTNIVCTGRGGNGIFAKLSLAFDMMALRLRHPYMTVYVVPSITMKVSVLTTVNQSGIVDGTMDGFQL